jgi:hypothetical protein
MYYLITDLIQPTIRIRSKTVTRRKRQRNFNKSRQLRQVLLRRRQHATAVARKGTMYQTFQINTIFHVTVGQLRNLYSICRTRMKMQMSQVMMILTKTMMMSL